MEYERNKDLNSFLEIRNTILRKGVRGGAALLKVKIVEMSARP